MIPFSIDNSVSDSTSLIASPFTSSVISSFDSSSVMSSRKDSSSMIFLTSTALGLSSFFKLTRQLISLNDLILD